MYPRANVQKAVLATFDKKKPKLYVEFQFNPTELSVERGCGFDSATSDKNAFKDFGGIQFNGAKVDSISMSFVLDTTEPNWMKSSVALSMMSPVILSAPTLSPAKDASPLLGGLINDDSVTDVIDAITQMTRISDDLKKDKSGDTTPHPRLLQFTWGEKIKFSGGIEKFSYKFTLFDSDGTPKRAEVELGMIGIFGEYNDPAEDLLFGEGESDASTTKKIKQ